jgi:CDP-glycerol glycerophosphotransferase (TagB/SpsB family)
LAEALQKNDIPEVHLLVRTSPAEDPIRFQEISEKYTFIKWNYPDWKLSRENHPEPWSQRVPSEQDVHDLRAILEHADLNINMLSTMSLDFMLFDKPVINPVFGTGENDLYNDQRFLKYAHIEYLVDSGATKIVTDQNELLQAVNFYLEHPEADRENRKELVALEVGCPLKGTGKRIAKLLREWG